MNLMVCPNGTFGEQPAQPNVHALTILSASSFSKSNPIVFLSLTEDSVLGTVPSAAAVSFITIVPVRRVRRVLVSTLGPFWPLFCENLRKPVSGDRSRRLV